MSLERILTAVEAAEADRQAAATDRAIGTLYRRAAEIRDAFDAAWQLIADACTVTAANLTELWAVFTEMSDRNARGERLRSDIASWRRTHRGRR